MEKKLEPSVFDWMTRFNSGEDSISEEKLEEYKKELRKIHGIKEKLERKETN